MNAILQLIVAGVMLKLSLLYPTTVCLVLLLAGLIWFFIMKKMFETYMDDYYPLGRSFVEQGTEYKKYEIITKNKTFVEEYRKNQNNEFVFASITEIK